MDDIFTNLRRTFNSGNILAKLIYINVGLFVVIRLTSVVLMLFNLGGFPFLQYLADAFVSRIAFVPAVDDFHLYVHAFRLPAYSV